MSCGPIVATEHKRQKITTDNNQIKIPTWSKNEVKCVILIMKIYDTYISQNSGIKWEIFSSSIGQWYFVVWVVDISLFVWYFPESRF